MFAVSLESHCILRVYQKFERNTSERLEMRQSLVTIRKTTTTTRTTQARNRLHPAPRRMHPRMLAVVYVTALALVGCVGIQALTEGNQTHINSRGNSTAMRQQNQNDKLNPTKLAPTITTTTPTPRARVEKLPPAIGKLKKDEPFKKNVTKTQHWKPVKKVKLALKKTANKTRDGKHTYGEQQEASLLRPLILRSLGLGGFAGQGMLSAAAASSPAESSQEGPAGQPQQQEEEEEEEVTQTIMMPMNGDHDQNSEAGNEGTAAASESQTEGGNSEESDTSANNEPPASAKTRSPTVLEAHGSPKARGHLKPEASLQLTSTEMSTLLNDKEGPAYYRERELAGDGVVLGEERPLGVAASNLGIHHMEGAGGFGLSPSSYESDAAFLANHRLAQAASGGGGYPDMGGFSHRFGAFGGDGGGDGYDGRLMQSPNEFNEYSSHFGSSPHHHHHHHPSSSSGGDYSPHSGLLRAGSGGGDFGHADEVSYGGHPESYHGDGIHHGGGSGYPRLEQHSSELYGSSGFGGHSAADLSYYGGANQRLLSAAAAHHPSAGGYHNHLEDAGYTSRYGAASLSGYDSRNFAASQQSNSMMSGPSKLVPLSPVVPVAEEVGGAASMQQFRASSSYSPSSSGSEAATGSNNGNHKEVHEPLDEQDLQASLAGQADETAATSSGSPSTAPIMHPDSTSNDASDDTGLVLNYPPPSDGGPSSSSSSSSGPTIEFSRFGSAGYLPPSVSPVSSSSPSSGSSSSNSNNNNSNGRSKKILKKMSALMSSSGSGGSMEAKHGAQSDYDPAENPAHAGKYIID